MDQTASREEVLAHYRPIRAGIRRVLSAAMRTPARADLMRAAKQLGLWVDGGVLDDKDDPERWEMLADIALFEPNQRGRRVFDTFLTGAGKRLLAPDRALAEQMAAAWFSLFRYAGRHPAGGVWLQDLLADSRRLWLMDESMEAADPPEGLVIGMRLFDAGPFHAGFGIITQPDEETVEFSLALWKQERRLPFRHSLAATLYADALRPRLPMNEDAEEMILATIDALTR
jgi:hypothetical protein